MKHNSEFNTNKIEQEIQDDLAELIQDLEIGYHTPKQEFRHELKQKFMQHAWSGDLQPQLSSAKNEWQTLMHGYKLRASLGFLTMFILTFVVFASLNSDQSPSYDWLINKVHAANEGFINAVSSSSQSGTPKDKTLTHVKISTQFGNLNQNCLGPGSIFPVPYAAEYESYEYWDASLKSEFPHTKYEACNQEDVCSVTLYNGINSIEYEGGKYAVDHGKDVYITVGSIEQYYGFNSSLFPRESQINVQDGKYVVIWQKDSFCEGSKDKTQTNIWQAEFDKNSGVITRIKVSDSNNTLISDSQISFNNKIVADYAEVAELFKFNQSVAIVKNDIPAKNENTSIDRLKTVVINGAKAARDYLLINPGVVITPESTPSKLNDLHGYPANSFKPNNDHPAYASDRNFYQAGEIGDKLFANRLKEIQKTSNLYNNTDQAKLAIGYDVGLNKTINGVQVGSQYTIAVYKSDKRLEMLVKDNHMLFYRFQRQNDKTISINHDNVNTQVYKSSQARQYMYQDEYLVAFDYNGHKYVISFFGDEPLAFNYKTITVNNLQEILDLILSTQLMIGPYKITREDLL